MAIHGTRCGVATHLCGRGTGEHPLRQRQTAHAPTCPTPQIVLGPVRGLSRAGSKICKKRGWLFRVHRSGRACSLHSCSYMVLAYNKMHIHGVILGRRIGIVCSVVQTDTVGWAHRGSTCRAPWQSSARPGAQGKWCRSSAAPPRACLASTCTDTPCPSVPALPHQSSSIHKVLVRCESPNTC